jgi:hypothetical protein
MYKSIPVPPKITKTAYASLTKVGSNPKYLANPPHTPDIFLSVVDKQSLFSITISPYK